MADRDTVPADEVRCDRVIDVPEAISRVDVRATATALPDNEYPDASIVIELKLVPAGKSFTGL